MAVTATTQPIHSVSPATTPDNPTNWLNIGLAIVLCIVAVLLFAGGAFIILRYVIR
jgi:hypothetical protein